MALYDTPPFVWVLIYDTGYRRLKTLHFPDKNVKMPRKLAETIQYWDEHNRKVATRPYMSYLEYKLEKYYLEDALKGPRLF